jgi:hypothetical protein
MYTQTFHVDPDIDHKEERVHHLLVDDSLFEATMQRLDAAHDHLDAAAAANETVGAIQRRLDGSLRMRIRHLKAAIEKYYESGPFNRDVHQKLHEMTLSIADHAECVSRRFEEPGGREQILSAVEIYIADLERVLDDCNQILRKAS